MHCAYMKKKIFIIEFIILSLSAFAGNLGYDVAAYVWPAYQPEPRWAELEIFSAGKGEWQNVWEAKPKWKGHNDTW